MNFAEAFAIVGVVFAIAGALVGLFWMMTEAGPSDYQLCLSGCKDGWGNYKNLECPELCLPLGKYYQEPQGIKWGVTNNTITPTKISFYNETLSYFQNDSTVGGISPCYYPPSCYSEQEVFLNQFPNQTMPGGGICYYAIYCNQKKWWKEVYE